MIRYFRNRSSVPYSRLKMVDRHNCFGAVDAPCGQADSATNDNTKSVDGPNGSG